MMRIGERDIGAGAPPLVIAEMSGNHNHSLDRAMAIVEAAAAAGAHALKLQTYTADTMTLPVNSGEFMVTDDASLWKGESLHALYSKAYTPWEWHEPLFDRCRELGMLAFSSPFDATAVDFLEKLGVPCFKIASFENTDLPLIRCAAATGKPLIISTGMATLAELDEAVSAARGAGCRDLVLLKCTSTYPATPENTNLRTIPHLRELFRCEIGLSDHTLGIGAAVASVALGASVIEKHFTLARADGGVDSAFSLEPAELAALTAETRRAWLALGEIRYGPTDAELPSLRHRRSLYLVRGLRRGDLITKDDVRAIRPGLGLPPKFVDQVIGRCVTRDVAMGTPLSWDLVGPPA